MKKPKKNYWEERSRMSNIPKLRFPEFSGEWEEKRIQDFAECCAGATPDTKKDEYWIDGTIPWMSSGEVNNTFIYSTEKKITQLGYDKTSTKLLPSNTVVIALAGQGKTRGTVAITRIELCTNQSLCAVLPDINLNSEYLFYFLSSQYKQLRNSSTGGDDSRGGLNLKIIGNFRLPYTTLAEQQKIADFLSNVDSIITAETKILNTLQKKKKALMQKLFTQQLRFKSANGTDFPAWEEKKVIDFAKVDTGANNTQDKVEDGPYPFYVRSPIIYRSNKYIFDFPEAVLTVGDGVGTGKVFHYVQGKFDCHQRVYVIHDFENVLGKYFYFYFSEKFYARVKPMSAKNSVDSVRREMITDMKIPIPCKAEQQKIADCLSSMDSLIQTQQKVVTTWLQRKKALLQKMFI